MKLLRIRDSLPVKGPRNFLIYIYLTATEKKAASLANNRQSYNKYSRAIKNLLGNKAGKLLSLLKTSVAADRFCNYYPQHR